MAAPSAKKGKSGRSPGRPNEPETVKASLRISEPWNRRGVNKPEAGISHSVWQIGRHFNSYGFTPRKTSYGINRINP